METSAPGLYSEKGLNLRPFSPDPNSASLAPGRFFAFKSTPGIIDDRPVTSLETGRIGLEPLMAGHAEELFHLLNDREIYRFIQDEPPVSVAELAERYRLWESRRSPDGSQQWLNWVMRSLESGLCIGFIQATIYNPQTADFAFVLGSTYWSRGFAFEASVAALHTLFTEYALSSIFSTTDRHNARALSLLTRLGFHQIEPASYPHGGVLPSDHAFQLDGVRSMRPTNSNK